LKYGVVYTFWADLELRANNDSQKALELLDKAKENGFSPTSYDYLLYSKALWKSDPEGAMRCLEKSIEGDSSLTNLRNFAAALYSVGDKRVRKVAQRILSEDPENCFAHILLALEAARSGERPEALRLVQQAEALSPVAEESAYIGEVYECLDDFQRAIARYLQAVEDSSDAWCGGRAYGGVAGCYISLGDARQSRKYLERAIRWGCPADYAGQLRQEYREKFGRET
jgi:tetratricopeptide (TPR) repeat protein